VLRRLRDAARGVDDQVPQWKSVAWPKVSLPPLRDEQRAAVAAWKTAQQGCIVMPTGTGKTEVALAAMTETGISTLIVAPVRDLMYQWHRRILAGLGYDACSASDPCRSRPTIARASTWSSSATSSA
jgi:superfamily II DNA or RNA helicase